MVSRGGTDIITLPQNIKNGVSQELALKYLDYKVDYELAVVKSNEVVELAKINSTILIHTEKEHNRTLEGRIIASSVLFLGTALSYKTYETTEPLRYFLNTIVENIKPSLFPNWHSLLLNENQWIVGYAASGINQFIRLFLLFGISTKKISILILQTSEGIISLGGATAALFVLFVFVVFSGVLLKLYLSDIAITPLSLKIQRN